MTLRSLPARLARPRLRPSFRPKKHVAGVFIVGAAVAAVASSPSLADPTVASKQAEAQRVLTEVRQLDSSLERAIEAYNLATLRLARVKRDLELNRQHLVLARSNLRHSQAALTERVVALYQSGSQRSTLEILLGATSLDDVLNRIDAVNRVSDQDVRILNAVIAYRTEVRRRQVRLQHARAEQAKIVAERAAERASVRSQLAQRRQLLSSIKSEIARIQAAEQARQAELARQAQQALAAQHQQAAAQALGGPAAGIPAAGSIAAPPSRYGGVVGIAMRYLGTPYRWGGADPSGFDCSGFTMYVFGQIGVGLPHNAAAQYGYGTPVSISQLQAGDLVFFDGLGHVGIYVGGGSFIHAPHSGDVVRISSLSGWYSSTFVGARRL